MTNDLASALRSRTASAYPPRGDTQLYRLNAVVTFSCHRCGQTKTSKLVAIPGGDYSRPLCNACYGKLSAEQPQEAPQPQVAGEPGETAEQEEAAGPVPVSDPLDPPLPSAADRPDLYRTHSDHVHGAASGWTLAVWRDHLTRGWCPVPQAVSRRFENRVPTGALVHLTLVHPGQPMLPEEVEQRVRVEHGESGPRLTGVVWPHDTPPGTRFSFTWQSDTAIQVASTLLDSPVAVDGRVVRHAYDPQVLTRDSGALDMAIVRDADALVMLTVRRLGLLDELGRAVLPDAALIKNVSEHPFAPPPAELRTTIRRLVIRGRLTREYGSRATVDGPIRYPAVDGQEHVELLCYAPECRKPTATELHVEESRGFRHVRGHTVAGHLMYIAHLGKGASWEARQNYREDHARAGLVGSHELPAGYTYVREHQRGA
ncbi:hypothetical protein [Streptomyces mirabilis]|uniref:hypothetical protein n=1 Tax=Streptomyces mirabilis TaxID=68239 RepID=UPI00339E435D